MALFRCFNPKIDRFAVGIMKMSAGILRVLFVIVLIVVPGVSAAEEDLQAVIERVIAAYGGERVLSEAKAIRQSFPRPIARSTCMRWRDAP